MRFAKHILAWSVLLCAPTAAAQPPGDSVQRALNDSTFTWLSSESDGIRMYYQEGSFAQRHRAMLSRSIRMTVDEVLSLLEEPPYEPVLNVFYLDSREQMRRIIGSPYSGFTDWDAHAIFLVVNPEWRSFEKHEFTHIITMGVWGAPDDTSRWMIEGICVYSDGWCRQYSVDEVAFTLLSGNQLPTLQQLFDDYRTLGEIRAGFAGASFIGFVRDTWGMDTVRRLWSEGTEDLDDLLGAEPDQLESAWKQYLKKHVRKDVRVDMDAINSSGCG